MTASAAPTAPAIQLDYDTESILPDIPKYHLNNNSSETQASSTRNGVLIVGADGYIGYYLLKYLLALQRNSKIYLIGLAERFNLGDLFAVFMENKLFDERVTQADFFGHVEMVSGNVGEDKYGLADAAFHTLAQNVHSVYHTGGVVSLLATYSDLRARNVQSVFNMVELAAACEAEGATSLHYISTWSILHVQTWQTTTTAKSAVWLDEQSVESFRPPTSNDHGYFKTRWVSEMLVEKAAQRGFPAVIYRCPAHTAPIGSLSVTTADNFTINLYLSMVRSGLILKTVDRRDGLESDVGMLPIDYIADTLVRLAELPEVKSAGNGEALKLHITNPRSVPYSQMPALVAELREDGAPGKLLDLPTWYKQLTAVSSEQANLEFSMYKEYLDKGHIMCTIGDARTKNLLEKLDADADDMRVRCPAVNVEYFRSILAQEKLFRDEAFWARHSNTRHRDPLRGRPLDLGRVADYAEELTGGSIERAAGSVPVGVGTMIADVDSDNGCVKHNVVGIVCLLVSQWLAANPVWCEDDVLLQLLKLNAVTWLIQRLHSRHRARM